MAIVKGMTGRVDGDLIAFDVVEGAAARAGTILARSGGTLAVRLGGRNVWVTGRREQTWEPSRHYVFDGTWHRGRSLYRIDRVVLSWETRRNGATSS